MRFLPVNHLKGNETLAVNIINSNLQILVREGAVLSEKSIRRLKQNGIQSVYIVDKKMSELLHGDVKDVIDTSVRTESVYNLKNSFERFEKQVALQKKSMRYGDIGELLFREVKQISHNLIKEIMHSSEHQITMQDIKSLSDYQFKHAINVAVLSLIIGAEINLDAKSLEELAFGALLSDIGFNWVNPKILLKTDKLSEIELTDIKKHVEYGYQYINDNTTFNAHVKSIIMHHHERMNGSGYPMSLNEKNIHPLSKIVMIADTYDALTSDRPYRKAFNQHEAIEYIMANAGRLFDFEYATIFTRKVTPYPVGSYVKLSNQQKGVVIENNKDHPLRPIVRTFGISSYTDHSSFQVNLLEHTNIVIEKIIYTLH